MKSTLDIPVVRWTDEGGEIPSNAVLSFTACGQEGWLGKQADVVCLVKQAAQRIISINDVVQICADHIQKMGIYLHEDCQYRKSTNVAGYVITETRTLSTR